MDYTVEIYFGGGFNIKEIDFDSESFSLYTDWRFYWRFGINIGQRWRKIIN